MSNIERSPNAQNNEAFCFIIRSSSLHSSQRVNLAPARARHPHRLLDFLRLEVCRRKKLNSRLRKNRVPDPRVKAVCAQLPGELARSAVRFVLAQSNAPARKCRLVVGQLVADPESALKN